MRSKISLFVSGTCPSELLGVKISEMVNSPHKFIQTGSAAKD